MFAPVKVVKKYDNEKTRPKSRVNISFAVLKNAQLRTTLSSFSDSTAYYSRDFSPIILRILLVCPTVEYFGVKVFCKELFARAKIGKISIIKKSTDRLGGFQLRYIKINAQLRTLSIYYLYRIRKGAVHGIAP